MDRAFTFDAIAEAATGRPGGGAADRDERGPDPPDTARAAPRGGALLAAVATAAETTPEVAGKPHRPTADAIRARADDLSMMVGDRPSTDGALAEQLGIPFALVLSGVTDAGRTCPTDPAPDEVAADLATLVRTVFGPKGS